VIQVSIHELFGESSPDEFVHQYYRRMPYSRSGAAKNFCSFAQWETLERVLAKAGADTMVCRQGEQFTGEAPGSKTEARALCNQGYTLLVRNAQKHDARLAGLADDFAKSFGGQVNIHIYATPAGQYGFGWHYDAEEVFILQTSGSKQYSLRKNTVNPWPLVETIPMDMQYEREIMPLMRCELTAGDWLYIPAGYWHWGEARQTAISLAIGVMPPTAIDIFDSLRTELLDSLLWRQRLPTAWGEIDNGRAACQQILGDLRKDLDRRLQDPVLVDRFLRRFR
jgi:ribosomal protein L16 Arg81 hydroxylase